MALFSEQASGNSTAFNHSIMPITQAHSNMGNALKEQGKIEEAIAAYEKALSIKPDYADAHYNIGTTLKNKAS